MAWIDSNPESNRGVAITGCGPDGEANAAFIVLACNSHDRLTAEVAKLREALELTLFAVKEGLAGNDTDAGPSLPSVAHDRRQMRIVGESVAFEELVHRVANRQREACERKGKPGWADATNARNDAIHAVKIAHRKAVDDERERCLAAVRKFKGDFPCAEIMGAEAAIRCGET
jgi:hypothetical protein